MARPRQALIPPEQEEALRAELNCLVGDNIEIIYRKLEANIYQYLGVRDNSDGSSTYAIRYHTNLAKQLLKDATALWLANKRGALINLIYQRYITLQKEHSVELRPLLAYTLGGAMNVPKNEVGDYLLGRDQVHKDDRYVGYHIIRNANNLRVDDPIEIAYQRRQNFIRILTNIDQQKKAASKAGISFTPPAPPNPPLQQLDINEKYFSLAGAASTEQKEEKNTSGGDASQPFAPADATREAPEANSSSTSSPQPQPNPASQAPSTKIQHKNSELALRFLAACNAEQKAKEKAKTDDEIQTVCKAAGDQRRTPTKP